MVSFYIFPRIKLIHFLNEALCQNINHFSPFGAHSLCPGTPVLDLLWILMKSSEPRAGLSLFDSCAGSSSFPLASVAITGAGEGCLLRGRRRRAQPGAALIAVYENPVLNA